jgi:urease beta subunit
MIPGEMFIAEGEIELNPGRKGVMLSVTNCGDRPIQEGSHYHFYETNPALRSIARKHAACGSTLLPARPCVSSRVRPAMWRWLRSPESERCTDSGRR